MERRSNRSRQPGLASRQYLLNVTRRHRPRAIVVSDLEGNVVASVEGRPFMDDGWLARRAAREVEQTIVRAALDDLKAWDDQPVVEKKSVSQHLKTRRAEMVAWWARRQRPTWLNTASKWVSRVDVDGRQLLVVAVGDANVSDAGRDAVSGLQRILAAA
jgi:hypothetical protein